MFSTENEVTSCSVSLNLEVFVLNFIISPIGGDVSLHKSTVTIETRLFKQGGRQEVRACAV